MTYYNFTRGALQHRGSLGSTSGTRGYVSLSTVNDLAVVDTQDNGSITDTATTINSRAGSKISKT